MATLEVTPKQLIEWVSAKIKDETTPLSERSDYELFVSLMRRKKELKSSESKKLGNLSRILEDQYRDERSDGLTEWRVTTKQLCYLFDRSRKTIAEWIKHGMPRIKQGVFDLRAVHTWWLESIYRVPEEEGDDSITEWRRRERRAKAQQEELKLGEMEKRFMLVEEHEKILSVACGDLRSTMLSWSARLFPTDDESRQALRQEVHELLENFVKCESFDDDRIKKQAEKKKASKKKTSKKTAKTTKKSTGKKAKLIENINK